MLTSFTVDWLKSISSKCNDSGQASWEEWRHRLYATINGDAFFPLNTWPPNMKTSFWQRPMKDKDVFKFFVFFVGNGGSHFLAAEWIVSTLHQTVAKQRLKRFYQLVWICRSMEHGTKNWFYYDIDRKRQLYLNGSFKLQKE